MVHDEKKGAILGKIDEHDEQSINSEDESDNGENQEKRWVSQPRRDDEVLLQALASQPFFAGCDPELLQKLAQETPCFVPAQDSDISHRAGMPLLVAVSGALEISVGKGPSVIGYPGTVVGVTDMLALSKEQSDTEAPCRRASKQTNSVRCILDVRPEDDADGEYDTEFMQSIEDAHTRHVIESCMTNLCPHTLPNCCLQKLGSQDKASQNGVVLQMSVKDGMAAHARVSRSRLSLKQDYATIAEVSMQTVKKVLEETPFWEQFEYSRDVLVGRFSSLLQLGVFPSLPLEIIWDLACISDFHTLREDHVICREGDMVGDDECLMIIQSGVLEASKLICLNSDFEATDRVVACLRAGTMIGDVFFLQSSIPRPASLRVKEEAEVISIPANLFLDLLARHPGVLAGLGGRIKDMSSILQRSLGRPQETLEFSSLFHSMDPNFVRAVATISERKFVSLGEMVRGEDENTHETSVLRLLEFGLVRVEEKGAGCVAHVDVGSWIGERLFFNRQKATHAGETQLRVGTPFAVMLCIPRLAFQAVLQANPQAAKAIAARSTTDAGREVRDHHSSKLAFLKSCSRSLIDSIASSLQRRSFEPGQTIIVQKSNDGGSLFVLVSGRAEVVINGITKKELGPGESFGELGTLGLVRSRAATVCAITYCACMELERPMFMSALEKHPSEKQHFEAFAKQHVAGAQNYQWPMFKDMSEKFLYFLNMHARRENVQQGTWSNLAGEPLPVNAAVLVTQGEIARAKGDKGRAVRHEVHRAGECFGEESLLGLPSSSFELESRTVSEVQLITKEIFEKIMQDIPDAREEAAEGIKNEMSYKVESTLGIARGSPDVLLFSALFRACSGDFVEKARAACEPRLYQPGELILERGEPGDRMFILLRGKCLQESTIKLKPPMVLAESEMLGFQTLCPYTVRAQGLCLFQTLCKQRFKDVLVNYTRESHLMSSLRCEEPDLVSNVASRLHKYELFSHTSLHFVTMACKGVDEVYFAPEDEIITRGQVCRLGETPMYVLIAGKAAVKLEFGDDLAVLKPGAMIGEGGSLGIASVRTATVKAWKDGLVRCLRLQGLSLQRACGEFPMDYESLAYYFQQRAQANAAFESARKAWLDDIVVPALLNCRIFRGFSSKLAHKIAEPLVKTTYAAGKTICVVGDRADSMILLLEGEAEIVSKQGNVVGRLFSGASIGEVGLLGLFCWRTATIRAVIRTTAVIIEASEMKKTMKNSPGGSQALVKLEEERRSQVSRGVPMTSLQFDECTVEDIAVRAIALHADRILLAPNQPWTVPPDSAMSGPHYWIFVRGRASLVMGPGEHPVNPIFTFRPGAGGLCPEQLCVEMEARIHASTPLEAFRISRNDLLLAARSVPTRWLKNFEKMEKDISKHLQAKLVSAKAVLDMARREMEMKSRPFFAIRPSNDIISRLALINKLRRNDFFIGHEQTSRPTTGLPGLPSAVLSHEEGREAESPVSSSTKQRLDNKLPRPLSQSGPLRSLPGVAVPHRVQSETILKGRRELDM